MILQRPNHRRQRACTALWERLIERDQIYLETYAGWYAVRDEAFYAESSCRDRDGDGPADRRAGGVRSRTQLLLSFDAVGRRPSTVLRGPPQFILPVTRRTK